MRTGHRGRSGGEVGNSAAPAEGAWAKSACSSAIQRSVAGRAYHADIGVARRAVRWSQPCSSGLVSAPEPQLLASVRSRRGSRRSPWCCSPAGRDGLGMRAAPCRLARPGPAPPGWAGWCGAVGGRGVGGRVGIAGHRGRGRSWPFRPARRRSGVGVTAAEASSGRSCVRGASRVGGCRRSGR